MVASVGKDMRDLVGRLKKLGWTVSMAGKSRYRCESPAGEYVIVPSFPGDSRSMKNTIAKLRRHGAAI